MKNSKRIAMMILALVLTLALASTAMAATVTVTGFDDGSPHTFTGYQIFVGTPTADRDGKLENIQWGNGVNQTGLIDALKAKYTDNTDVQALTDTSTAAAVASAITSLGFTDDSAQARELALLINGCTTGTGIAFTDGATNVADGYYIIKDSGNFDGQDAHVQNLPLLQVSGTINISKKVEKPELHKQILHDDPDTWGIVGDNQVGDTVQFKVTSNVPDVAPFTSYTFVMHDEMDKGLVLDENSIVVKMGQTTLQASDYTFTKEAAGADGQTVFTVAINNAKTLFTDHKGEAIEMTYSAVLTENVAKKLYKEQNKAYLEYSTTHDDQHKGTTVPDVVTDYSFSIPVKKVDGNQYDTAADKDTVASLAGAKFTLKNGNTDAAATIAFKQVGNEYIVDPNGAVTEIETTADGDGKFYIEGLNDATTYYLYETQAPVGYNAITDPIAITITATYNDDGSIASLSAVADGEPVTYTIENGEVTGGSTVIVKNNSGTTLPETGGIGTTLFYVGGAVIMLLAAALIIARKKMTSK